MVAKLIEILETSLGVAKEAKDIRQKINKELELKLKDYGCEQNLRAEYKSRVTYNKRRLQIYDDLIIKISSYLGKK